MLTPAFRRLVWKDARTLAGVWVALLFGVALLQALTVATRDRKDDQLWVVLQGMSAPLAFCFAVAAAGILFAGEAEEGTDDWLRTLPVRARTLVCAKLGTGFVSLVGFILAGGVTATVCTLAARRPPEALGPATGMMGWSLLVSLMGFAAGLFFSVRQKRVTVVFVSAAVAGVGLAILGVNLVRWLSWLTGEESLSHTREEQETFGLVTLFVLLGIVDVWQGVRWSQGRGITLWPARWSADERLRASPMAAWWLERLVWTSTLGSPGSRAGGVLLWRELRTAVPFGLGWTLAGLVAMAVDWLSPHGFPRALASLLVISTPVVCGLMTMLGDQFRQSQLFLGDRGLTPGRTWLAKHAVWLGCAAILLTVLLIADHLVHRQSLYGTLISTKVLRVWPHYDRPPSPTEVQHSLWWAFSLLVSLYVVGAVCAFTIRRAVMCCAVALGMSFVVTGWHMLVLAGDTLLWLTTWPFVALWLIGTWRLMDGWQTGDASRRMRLREAAWFGGAVIVLLCAFSIARRTQIPDVTLTPDTLRAAHTAHQGPEGQTARNMALNGEITRFLSSHQSKDDWGRPRPQFSPMSSADIEQLDGDLHAIAEQCRTVMVFAHESQAFVPGMLANLAAFARVRGEELVAAGRPVAAFDLAVDVLTLLRAIPADSFEEVAMQIAKRQTVFGLAADWANDPARTREELEQVWRANGGIKRETFHDSWAMETVYLTDKAAGGIKRETLHDSWQLAQVMAENYAETLRQFFAREGPLYDARWRTNVESADWGEKLAIEVGRLFGEQARLERLARVFVQEADRISRWQVPMTTESLPERNPVARQRKLSSITGFGYPDKEREPVATREEIERWVASTAPLLPSELQPAMALTRLSESEYWSRCEVAAERATRLILALQLYRREQGKFPRQLSELVPDYLEVVPADPFTLADFQYLSEGLSAPLVMGDVDQVIFGTTDRAQATIIPAGQPLLWSPGPLGTLPRMLEYSIDFGRIQYFVEITERADHSSTSIANVIAPNANIRQQLANPPAGSPDKVAFAVLGAPIRPWGIESPGASPE